MELLNKIKLTDPLCFSHYLSCTFEYDEISNYLFRLAKIRLFHRDTSVNAHIQDSSEETVMPTFSSSHHLRKILTYGTRN